MAGFFKKALGAFVQIDDEGFEHEISVDDLDEEARRLLAEIEAGAAQAPPDGSAYAEQAQANLAATEPAAVAVDLTTGMAFGDIYAAAAVPPSPYSAEMLLKVADGLKALPLAQARAAVDAMDSADDRWTVGDVLLDAERKIGALRGVEATMDAQRRASEDEYNTSISAIDHALTATRDEVQKQIAELEALLQEANETATVERAKALSELEATRAAATGEIARLQGETLRLKQVYDFLGEPQGV